MSGIIYSLQDPLVLEQRIAQAAKDTDRIVLLDARLVPDWYSESVSVVDHKVVNQPLLWFTKEIQGVIQRLVKDNSNVYLTEKSYEYLFKQDRQKQDWLTAMCERLRKTNAKGYDNLFDACAKIRGDLSRLRQDYNRGVFKPDESHDPLYKALTSFIAQAVEKQDPIASDLCASAIYASMTGFKPIIISVEKDRALSLDIVRLMTSKELVTADSDLVAVFSNHPISIYGIKAKTIPGANNSIHTHFTPNLGDLLTTKGSEYTSVRDMKVGHLQTFVDMISKYLKESGIQIPQKNASSGSETDIPVIEEPSLKPEPIATPHVKIVSRQVTDTERKPVIPDAKIPVPNRTTHIKPPRPRTEYQSKPIRDGATLQLHVSASPPKPASTPPLPSLAVRHTPTDDRGLTALERLVDLYCMNPASTTDSIQSIKQKVEPLMLCGDIAQSIGSTRLCDRIQSLLLGAQKVAGQAYASDRIKELTDYLTTAKDDLADTGVQSRITSIFSQITRSFGIMNSGQDSLTELIFEGKMRKPLDVVTPHIKPIDQPGYATEALATVILPKVCPIQEYQGKDVTITELRGLLQRSYASVYAQMRQKGRIKSVKGKPGIRITKDLVELWSKKQSTATTQSLESTIESSQPPAQVTDLGFQTYVGQALPVTKLVTMTGRTYGGIQSAYRKNLTKVDGVLCVDMTDEVAKRLDEYKPREKADLDKPRSECREKDQRTPNTMNIKRLSQLAKTNYRTFCRKVQKGIEEGIIKGNREGLGIYIDLTPQALKYLGIEDKIELN